MTAQLAISHLFQQHADHQTLATSNNSEGLPKELITVRVDTTVKDLISQLAREDDRTVSYIAERLIIEALFGRGLIGQKEPGGKPSGTE